MPLLQLTSIYKANKKRDGTMKDYKIVFLADFHVYDREGIFGRLTTNTVLFEKDYPAYTFKRSSGASLEAFYQPYLIRGKDTVLQ